MVSKKTAIGKDHAVLVDAVSQLTSHLRDCLCRALTGSCHELEPETDTYMHRVVVSGATERGESSEDGYWL